MGIAKLKLPAAVVLVCVAFFVTLMQVKANEETDDAVGESAIWRPEAGDLEDIAQTCKTEASPDYTKCFVDQMGSLASSEAVLFTQTLVQESPQHTGYLKGLREAGPVDLGYVEYPGTAQLSQGWVLVNGNPAVVDVDNLNLLPRAALEQDAQFKALRSTFQQLELMATNEDRSADNAPQVQPLGDGSQRFVIPYTLKEPCLACRPIAHANFGFDFDPTGKFLGVKFIRVDPIN